MHLVLDDRVESAWIGWRLLRNDGEIRRVESRGTPVVYDGQPAVQVVIRDLTDQRRRERQLAALNGALGDLSTADSRTAVAERAVERDVYRTGRSRAIEGYDARGDALTDAVATVCLVPVADHGLLWVGTAGDGFDSTDRDLLEMLGRSLGAAFDRLDT